MLHFSRFVRCEGNVRECNFVSAAISTGTVGSVAFLVCFVSCEGNVRECNSVSTAVSPGAPGSHPSTAGAGEGTLRPCQSPPSLDPQLLPFRPSSTQLSPASLLWELGPAARTRSPAFLQLSRGEGGMKGDGSDGAPLALCVSCHGLTDTITAAAAFFRPSCLSGTPAGPQPELTVSRRSRSPPRVC